MELSGVKKLLDTMRQLRAPNSGCPWDRAQTHKSLIPYFFEELHEFQETVLSEAPSDPHFQEELGDLLFQVIFHAQILEENSFSNLDKIANNVAEKLMTRHPHVFDPKAPRLKSPEDVEKNWEQRKLLEKNQDSLWSWKALKKIPASMGALGRSQRMGEKAASLGFDWENALQVLEKVQEEILEIHEAPDDEAAQEEFGDLLFALTQYARKRGWNAETSLALANKKFQERFRGIEELSHSRGQKLKQLNMLELNALWDEVKRGKES